MAQGRGTSLEMSHLNSFEPTRSGHRPLIPGTCPGHALHICINSWNRLLTTVPRPITLSGKLFISYRSVKLWHSAIPHPSGCCFPPLLMAIKFYLHSLDIVNVIGLTRWVWRRLGVDERLREDAAGRLSDAHLQPRAARCQWQGHFHWLSSSKFCGADPFHPPKLEKGPKFGWQMEFEISSG